MIILNPTGRFKIDQLHLSPQQMDYFNAMQWLINDGPRRSGRSHVLALAFIQKAMDFPNRPIPIFDHYQESQNASNQCITTEIVKCINMIETFVEGTNFPFTFEISHMKNVITARYRQNTYPDFFGKWGS